MDFRIVMGSLAWAAAGVAPLQSALAQTGAPTSRPTYTCIAATGRTLKSDRSIAECADREQRVLNADGSLREILPPTLTAVEKEAEDARRLAEKLREKERQEAVLRDKSLLAHYPNEAAHRKVRDAALDPYRRALAGSDERMAALALERKPLLNEMEFYLNKPLPLKLRAQLDANDALTEAQRSAGQNLQAEVSRINQIKDSELERLRYLWSGAPPGSTGTLPATASTATSSSAR